MQTDGRPGPLPDKASPEQAPKPKILLPLPAYYGQALSR